MVPLGDAANPAANVALGAAANVAPGGRRQSPANLAANVAANPAANLAANVEGLAAANPASGAAANPAANVAAKPGIVALLLLQRRARFLIVLAGTILVAAICGVAWYLQVRQRPTEADISGWLVKSMEPTPVRVAALDVTY